MKKTIGINFDVKVMDKNSISDTFDLATIGIAYHGKNRNKSIIEKNVFDEAIPSMFNRPLVGHYLPDEDDFGGHDFEFLQDQDGKWKMANLTTPFGVVPESAKWAWFTDSDSSKEYLVTEVLLWKRQYGYDTLSRKSEWGQSMEIVLKDWSIDEDGYLVIKRFEFEAFCILGSKVEPCFEDAKVQMSDENYSKRSAFNEMLNDYQNLFGQMLAEANFDIKEFRDKAKEGGILDKKKELLAKYQLTAEQLNLNLEEITLEDLQTKIDEFNSPEQKDEQNPDVADEKEGQQLPEETPQEEQFSLTLSQLFDEVWRSCEKILITDEEYGYTYFRYWVVDIQDSEVIAYDSLQGFYVGLPFTMDGDSVIIDFESAKRKKIQYVDFIEGDNTVVFDVKKIFGSVNAKIDAIKADFDAYKAEFKTKEADVEELREYAKQQKKAEHDSQVAEVLEKFAELKANDEFVELTKKAYEFENIQDLINQCYIIKGKSVESKKFNLNKTQNSMKLPFTISDNQVDSDEPYGGLFLRLKK